jgi:hypothetical protein
MRFLVDMNLSPRWVDFLAAAGHEAVHWMDVGGPNAPDREILEHARRDGQVIRHCLLERKPLCASRVVSQFMTGEGRGCRSVLGAAAPCCTIRT